MKTFEYILVLVMLIVVSVAFAQPVVEEAPVRINMVIANASRDRAMKENANREIQYYEQRIRIRRAVISTIDSR